ncbi:GroES-like protein [Mycena maculata]|uniref:GroES-like protein n=1 Tax=Mycena maculata TaxID=230809 RepID=A0AAD7N7P9_9AGAR|nr:GroES-like protein [Mycena maculata]
MSTPTHMQAVTVTEDREIAVKTVAIPSIADNEILVQIKAAAQNPTDWKHITAWGVSRPGNIVGCDYAGVVVKAGTEVKNVKIGDRVAGFVHGARKNDLGSYAEYLRAEYDLAWSVPEGTSFEEAAAIGGIASETAAMAFYYLLGFAWPGTSSTPSRTVLIWSGSTSVGQYAIQFARASGATVVATGSPHNHELLKTLGAATVFDYKSPTVVQDIKRAYPDIDAALDCVSEHGSTKQAAACLSRPGKVLVLLPVTKDSEGWNPDAEIAMFTVYTTRGEAWDIDGITRPAVPEARAYAAKWLVQQAALVKSGQLKANPIKVIPGGLHGVKDGFELMKAGKVSAQKLVYQIAA